MEDFRNVVRAFITVLVRLGLSRGHSAEQPAMEQTPLSLQEPWIGVDDQPGEWLWFNGQPLHRQTVSSMDSKLFCLTIARCVEKCLTCSSRQILITLGVVGLFALSICGVYGLVALRRRRRNRYISLPITEKDSASSSAESGESPCSQAIKSVRRRFRTWSERRARRKARRQAIKKFINDAVASWSSFITSSTSASPSGEQQIQPKKNHDCESYNEKESQDSGAPLRPSSPSDSDPGTTMAQELAQFREAIEVVDSLVAAEEGRTREARPPHVPWHVSVSSYPGFVNSGGASPYHDDDDEGDNESLPPYDDGMSSVADGFRQYTPSSSQDGGSDQDHDHFLRYFK